MSGYGDETVGFVDALNGIQCRNYEIERTHSSESLDGMLFLLLSFEPLNRLAILIQRLSTASVIALVIGQVWRGTRHSPLRSSP
jgi:hypothetical protein